MRHMDTSRTVLGGYEITLLFVGVILQPDATNEKHIYPAARPCAGKNNCEVCCYTYLAICCNISKEKYRL